MFSIPRGSRRDGEALSSQTRRPAFSFTEIQTCRAHRISTAAGRSSRRALELFTIPGVKVRKQFVRDTAFSIARRRCSSLQDVMRHGLLLWRFRRRREAYRIRIVALPRAILSLFRIHRLRTSSSRSSGAMVWDISNSIRSRPTWSSGILRFKSNSPVIGWFPQATLEIAPCISRWEKRIILLSTFPAIAPSDNTVSLRRGRVPTRPIRISAAFCIC